MKRLGNLVVIFSICMLLVACDKECTHQYQSEITREASCAQEGKETFVCTLCQHSYTQSIPVLEHIYDSAVVEKEATCAEEGLQKQSCTVCGATKSETIEKLPHTLSDFKVIKEPNCTEQGEQTGKCTVCGTGGFVEKIPTNAAHKFVKSIVREATCTQKGEGANICSLCQHTESYKLELKEHTYSSATTVKKATCTSKGEKQRTCTKCGHIVKESIAAAGHKWERTSCSKPGVCMVCKVADTKAGHTYTVLSDKKGNDFFAGIREKECKLCGKEKTEYYTDAFVYDLEEIKKEIADYAKEKGFKVSLDTGEDVEAKYTENVFPLRIGKMSQDKFIAKGKKCIDYVYDDYANTPAGISVYTAHIRVYYTMSGALGTGTFGVLVDVTS